MIRSEALQEVLSRDHQQDRQALEQLLERCRDVPFEPGPCPVLVPGATGDQLDDPDIPEIDLVDLDDRALKDAMCQSGYLIVRNFFPAALCDQLRSVVDALLDESGAEKRTKLTFSGEPGVFNDPPRNIDELMEKTTFGVPRSYLRATGAAMCVESPSVAVWLMELYEERGIKRLVENYLGDESTLSALKWVLRRTVNEDIGPDGWHQDGAFMGRDIHSLNMWVALNPCGADSGAPGLDLIPGRSRAVYESRTGKHAWMMTDRDIDQDFAEPGPCSPRFGAGDAIFFDHLSIHRTQFGQQFNRARYAIESWFFARSKCPRNQVPLAW